MSSFFDTEQHKGYTSQDLPRLTSLNY